MDPSRTRHVVVAFPLAADAVAVLAERLGSGFGVRDVRADGPAADIVLAPPCSPQAIGHLKQAFPGASVVIVELEDLLRGVSLGGPVSRSLDAGADAYYVARSTEALGAFLGSLPLATVAAAAEVFEAQHQPVALPAPSDGDDLLSRVRRAARPEPVRRSDPATDP